MRCPTCDLGHLPACEGEHDPAVCAPDRTAERHAKSLNRSSLEHGWPAKKRPKSPPVDPPRRFRAPGQAVRVAFWLSAFYRGGAERWHLDLIRRLDPARVRVVGVAIENPTHTDADMVAELHELAVVGYGSSAAVGQARGADVTVTCGPLPRAALVSASPRPVIVTVSHGDGNCPYTARWIADAIDSTDRFVACAGVGLATIPPAHRADAAVIRNGVDPARVVARRTRADARASWGVPESAKVLGYLGRFTVGDKRADLVARVAPHLPGDWRVVMVGGGHGAAEIAAHAARSGRTALVPWVDRPGDSLVGFDVLANPSAIEGFGLSMAEAMMAGVPVVGTETGFAAEMPGLLAGRVPLDATPEQLAAEVLRVARDAPGTAEIAGRAKLAVLEQFTIGAFVGRWTDYLESTIPAVKPRGPLAETIARQAEP